MGIYAHVMDGKQDFKCACPTCGQIMSAFQTKENVKTYPKQIDFRHVSNFYSTCEGCGAGVEFSLYAEKKNKENITIDDYIIEKADK